MLFNLFIYKWVYVLVVTFNNGWYACTQNEVTACESGNATGTKASKASELVVGSYWIDSSTEFVILASNGIWEVKPQDDMLML